MLPAQCMSIKGAILQDTLIFIEWKNVLTNCIHVKKVHSDVNPVRADKVAGIFPVRELKGSILYKPAQLMLIKGAMLKHILVFIEWNHVLTDVSM